VDGRDELEKKKHSTSARKLYSRFLAYRYFVMLERPLIVCEGQTDNLYLKHAIRKLAAFHPKLGVWSGTAFNSAVAFFSYANQAHGLLELSGGTGDLKFFFLHYERRLQTFKHRPLKHPVIVLIDNDKGANEIFSVIKEKFAVSISVKSPDSFFHIIDNLYLVKTPERGSTGMSCIENFFDPSVLKTELNGKKFNLAKVHKADGEYGKAKFANEVVRPNADKIDFSKFAPLLDRIVAVIDNYAPPAMPAAAEP
jgi:RNA-directed DNA polymerase